MQTGNAEAIKFDTPGQITTLTVRRVEEKIDTQPDGTVKTWSNGDPMKVFIFHGTVDGEERTSARPSLRRSWPASSTPT
jgi:hypothetical protein